MSENRMSQQELTDLINRRETRSPRSTLAITLAVVIIAASAYTVVELILQVTGNRPLLMTVGAAMRSVTELFDTPVAIAVGVVAIILGLLVCAAALTPGRRARHTLNHPRSVVVDNAVIASALARHAAHAGQVGADSVRVSVTHRTAEVRITPTSGSTVDRTAVTRAVEEQIALYRLAPAIRPTVVIETAGRVGA